MQQCFTKSAPMGWFLGICFITHISHGRPRCRVFLPASKWLWVTQNDCGLDKQRKRGCVQSQAKAGATFWWLIFLNPPHYIFVWVGMGRIADLDRGLDVIPVFSRTCDDQPRMTIGAPRRYTVYFVIDDVRTALRPDDLGHKQTSHFSASLSPGLLARVIVYQFSLPLLGQCRLVSSCSKLILFTRIICIL